MSNTFRFKYPCGTILVAPPAVDVVDDYARVWILDLNGVRPTHVQLNDKEWSALPLPPERYRMVDGVLIPDEMENA